MGIYGSNKWAMEGDVMVEMLLEKESYCKAEIKTIAHLRKRCRNKEIGSLLKEKYAQYKGELNKE